MRLVRVKETVGSKVFDSSCDVSDSEMWVRLDGRTCPPLCLNQAGQVRLLNDLKSLSVFDYSCFDEQTARQSCTVQPRSGSPQPDCRYFPSSTMHGTVGSSPEYLNISMRYSRLVCASRSIKAIPFEL